MPVNLNHELASCATPTSGMLYEKRRRNARFDDLCFDYGCDFGRGFYCILETSGELTAKYSGVKCSPAIKLVSFKLSLAPTASAVIWTARHGAEPISKIVSTRQPHSNHSKPTWCVVEVHSFRILIRVDTLKAWSGSECKKIMLNWFTSEAAQVKPIDRFDFLSCRNPSETKWRWLQ